MAVLLIGLIVLYALTTGLGMAGGSSGPLGFFAGFLSGTICSAPCCAPIAFIFLIIGVVLWRLGKNDEQQQLNIESLERDKRIGKMEPEKRPKQD